MLAACTSSWHRHESQLATAEANGQYARALTEARWLVDNAEHAAPAKEQVPAAEAERYVHLARVAIKAGKTSAAIDALRQALTADPHQAGAVRAEIDNLPLAADQLERLRQEFAWNSAALAPGDNAFADAAASAQCWSYRVREVRVRHNRTVQTADGPQREVTYDARPWRFDAQFNRWQPEGEWTADVGTEIELVAGPVQPRYRAIVAADHEFVADDAVPPCHRGTWQGPYDPRGTVFVTERLP